jgi:heat shock protein HtpX
MNSVFLRHAAHNILHSVLIMLSMMLICGTLGWLIWGLDGVVYLSILTAVALVLGSRISPSVVLKMYGALPIREGQAPQLIRMVQKLAQKAGLPVMPQIYYIPIRTANAFSVGGAKGGAIAITQGLMHGFTSRELQGVLAHEVGHLRRNDGLIISLAGSVSYMVSIMSWIGRILVLFHLPLLLFRGYQTPWLLIIILLLASPMSVILQLALSRTREFEADLEAVKLTGDPLSLASGLQKIERLSESWLERLFLEAKLVPEPSWLRTHPATEERIRRLLELETDLALEEPSESSGSTAAFPRGRHEIGPSPHWLSRRFSN